MLSFFRALRNNFRKAVCFIQEVMDVLPQGVQG